MPYPFNPAWSGSYQPAGAYAQPQAMPMPQQPMMGYQQQGTAAMKVDGPAEAMNRFLMRYPANQLMPGFVSEALFDVNGRQFHTLSIEPDGRRNLETFDYTPHVEQAPITIDGADFVSRAEFDDFTAKVNAALGAINGIHGPVQAAAGAVPNAAAPAAAVPAAAPAAAYVAGAAADAAGAADLPRHAAGM